MADKLLISISASQTTAARWRRRGLIDCREFPNNETGWVAFNQFIESAANAPVYILADSVEEDLRFETLPHARGSDRAQMVKRKLGQIYRSTPYYAAKLWGRESNKRRDDRFFFSAVTNAELIDDWMQILLTRNAPIAGVFLAPMVAPALLAKLNINMPNVLVVMQTSAGLRQTYVRDRSVCVSRLTPREKRHDNARSVLLGDEITSTRRYLESVKAKPHDEPFSVVIIDYDGSLPKSELQFNPDTHFLHIDADEVAKRCGLQPSLLARFPDALQLLLLGMHVPDINLAQPQVTHNFRYHQQRRALYALSSSLACSALIWSGINLYQRHDYEAQSETLAAQTAQQQAKYLEATRQFPTAPASAENLRRVVNANQALQTGARTPELLFGVVGQAFDQSQNVALKRLGWTAAAPPTAESTAQPAASGARTQAGFIEGEIKPFAGDYRAALESIDRLVALLKSDGRVGQIHVEQLPLNVNSAAALSGSTQIAAQSGSAPFKLAIELKPGL